MSDQEIFDIRTAELRYIRPLLNVPKGGSCMIPECVGGWRRVPDERSMEGYSRMQCACQALSKWQDKLGATFMECEVRVVSPLRSLHTENVHLSGGRIECMGHLRDGILHHPRGTNVNLRSVSDVEVLMARFGDYEDDDPLALNLANIFRDPELLILYLGERKTKNSILPDIVQENLAMRQREGKPTWVVTYEDWRGTPSYSSALDRYLATYKKVEAGTSGTNSTSNVSDGVTPTQPSDWLQRARARGKK